MITQLLTPLTCLLVAMAILFTGAPWSLPDTDAPDPASLVKRKAEWGLDPFIATAGRPLVRRARRRKRGAIYARFSTKFQASIDDQVRACREWCDAQDVDVAEEMVFTDEATSGKKSRRRGLDQLKAALAAKRVEVLVVFTTNRLHRSAYKSRQFLEEEVIDRGVRVVCVRSGIDSADEKAWRVLHSVHAIADEMMLGGTADAVRNAHAGALLEKLVTGRLPHGYTGEAIPGRLTRLQRPKRRVVIDPITGEWIKKIYSWYDSGTQSVEEIVVRLGREGAPPPVGCIRWTPKIVRWILSNPRYTGRWAYGATRSRWLSSKDYAVQERQEKPLQEAQFEDLRLIDDALFLSVQAKLAGRNQRGGRKTREGKRRPQILNKILRCALHDRPLNRGDGFYCPECRRSGEPGRLYSELPADVALRTLCRRLADAIRGDGELVKQVVAALKEQAEALQRPDLSALTDLQRRREKLTQKIAFVQDNPGESPADLAESRQNLKKLRGERAAVDAEVARLGALAKREIRVPTDDEVRAVVVDFYGVLAQAADGADPADAQVLRQVILDLTGGSIRCSQQGEARAKRGWVRGSFELRLISAIGRAVGGNDGAGGDHVVDVDFAETSEAEALAERVIELYDQGLPLKLIAKQLGKPRNLIARALDYWFGSRGLVREDGRTRRSHLKVKHAETPLYQRLADDVKRLADGGMLFQQIARQLDVDRNTVTQSWTFWHETRGLTAPTGRERRKTLAIKTEKPYVRRKRDASESEPEQHRPAA